MSEEAQEKWREDFPIEWGADNYVTRREFTKFLVLVSGATCAGNAYFVAQKFRAEQQSFPAVTVADMDEIQPGQVKLFRYPTEDVPAILIRQTNGEYVAYMQRCTHLSCPVLYEANMNKMICPCHHGEFDAATGRVLAGPPPRPLPRIRLRVENGKIMAEGVEPA
jgi:Rieske Fe-S protein